MIERDGVDVLIGCLSSASRKRVKDVCEQKGVLLFYPMIFEGLEQSPAVVYVGGGPEPATLADGPLGHRLLESASASVLPAGQRVDILEGHQESFRGELEKHGLEPVGVRSLPLGQVDGFDPIIEEIRRNRADIVLDTLDLESDLMFFKTLGRYKIKAADLPVVSICLGEDQLRTLDHRLIAGHYSALNYFEAIDTPENARFLKRLRAQARRSLRQLIDRVGLRVGPVLEAGCQQSREPGDCQGAHGRWPARS